MSTSRYKGSPRINLGTQLGTSEPVILLRKAIKSGSIPIIGQIIATGNDRLDSLAGTVYGDAKYWWILAAASEIGWGLQIPPGTVIKIVRLDDVQRFVS